MLTWQNHVQIPALVMNSMKFVIPLHFISWKKKTPNNAVTPQSQSQFTPKMKVNAVKRFLSSLVWTDQCNEMQRNDKLHWTHVKPVGFSCDQIISFSSNELFFFLQVLHKKNMNNTTDKKMHIILFWNSYKYRRSYLQMYK